VDIREAIEVEADDMKVAVVGVEKRKRSSILPQHPVGHPMVDTLILLTTGTMPRPLSPMRMRRKRKRRRKNVAAHPPRHRLLGMRPPNGLKCGVVGRVLRGL